MRISCLLTQVVIANQDTYQVDTSNVLFLLSGAFVGLDKVVKKRIAKGVSIANPWKPTAECYFSPSDLVLLCQIEMRMKIVSCPSSRRMVKRPTRGVWSSQQTSSRTAISPSKQYHSAYIRH